jgi:hypothetical protein
LGPSEASPQRQPVGLMRDGLRHGSHRDSQSSAPLATAGTRDALESFGPYLSGAPASPLSDDDLLLLAIWWVKAIRGDGPDFVPEVALVFRTLKGELQ